MDKNIILLGLESGQGEVFMHMRFPSGEKRYVRANKRGFGFPALKSAAQELLREACSGDSILLFCTQRQFGITLLRQMGEAFTGLAAVEAAERLAAGRRITVQGGFAGAWYTYREALDWEGAYMTDAREAILEAIPQIEEYAAEIKRRREAGQSLKLSLKGQVLQALAKLGNVSRAYDHTVAKIEELPREAARPLPHACITLAKQRELLPIGERVAQAALDMPLFNKAGREVLSGDVLLHASGIAQLLYQNRLWFDCACELAGVTAQAWRIADMEGCAFAGIKYKPEAGLCLEFAVRSGCERNYEFARDGK